MATQTFHGIYETGGGRMVYVFHVLGYPWAVCTDKRLVDLLAQSNDQTRYVKRKMFGPVHWGDPAIYPADSVPVFPLLDAGGLGSETWSIDPANGVLSSSGWSVDILDNEIGYTWPHAPEGDEIWGLEGLHRVCDLEMSDSAGWGTLSASFMRLDSDGNRPTVISLVEDSGTRLNDRVAALTGSGYVRLWCEHECLAVDAVETSDQPALELNISGAGDGRGLYRSRVSDHLYRPTIDLTPTVSDVPRSIAGGYCHLWAIPITDNGMGFVRDGDGNPYVAKFRQGVVSSNIRTRSRMTTVEVLPAIDALKLDVQKIELAKASSTHLKKYVLCRGANSGTNPTNIYENYQKPHFLIQETRSASVQDDPHNEYPERNVIPVWLCRRGETRTFDSYEEILDALRDELEKIRTRDPSQTTGSEETGNNAYPVMWSTNGYRISVNSETNIAGTNIVQLTAFCKYRGSQTISDPRDFWPCRISGPLAFILGIGSPTDIYDSAFEGDVNFTNYNFWKRYYNNTQKGIFSLEYDNWHGLGVTADNQDTWLFAALYTDDHPENMLLWQKKLRDWSHPNSINLSPYYYQHDWVNHPPPGTAHEISYWDITSTTEFNIPSGDEGSVLWMEDSASFENGETFQLDKKYTGVIDGITSDDDSDMVGVVDGTLTVHAENKSWIGASLFFVPIMEVELSKIEDAVDSNLVGKKISVSTNRISQVFRSLLGEETSDNQVAPELQISHCPFFTDDEGEDSTSLIDWQSMDAVVNPYTWHIYKYEVSTNDNLYSILKNELLLHCATMTYEWDFSLLQYRSKFKPVEALNASMAVMLGRIVDDTVAIPDVPIKDHNALQIVNKICLDSNAGTFVLNGDRTASVVISTREIKIKPSISQFVFPMVQGTAAMDEFYADLVGRFRDTLRHLSRPRAVQSLQLTSGGLFRTDVGVEALMTNGAARNPMSHRLGLYRQPVLVISKTHNLSDEIVDITYQIGGKQSYGWAPACRLNHGNFSVHTGYWHGTPEEHEFTDASQPEDVWFFDCYDLRVINSPVARPCACEDYAVFAVELGTRNYSPQAFTCEVDENGLMTLTGEVGEIDESKDYVIFFAHYSDCQPCQKYWVFGADGLNMLGDENDPASRWI